MKLRNLPGVLAFSVISVLLSNFAAAANCDRECLIKTLNQYLDAVTRHDPSKAPLAKNFRSTENAQEVKVGEGTWKSVTKLGEVQRRYADPISGQVGYLGLVQEAEDPAITSLRLRVVDRKVTEAEWILGRKGMALHNPEGFIKYPPPDGKVSASNRTPRDQLIAAADSYFSGIHNGDGSIVLAHPGCSRVENGTWMVGNFEGKPVSNPNPTGPTPMANSPDPSVPKPGDGVTEPYFRDDRQCNSGFERMGVRGGGGGVVNRHYFADEEAGVAWGTVIFATKEGAKDPRGNPRKALYLTEVFKVEQGKIRGIYAAMHYLPLEITTSGWPDGR